jgi:hypothetical protein
MLNKADHTQIPNTQSVVTYAYTIKANGVEIGTLQGFNPSANRPVERVREILNTLEDTFEIVPGRSEFKISIDRIETYNKNVIKALGYNIFGESIAQIRDPITIVEQITGPNGESRQIVYDRCWITSWSKTVQEGQITSKENVSLEVERIFMSNT